MQKLFSAIIISIFYLNLSAFQQDAKQKILNTKDLPDTTKSKQVQVQDTSKAGSVDSSKIKRPEKLLPLPPNNFYLTGNTGNILRKDEILKLDHRYAGDLFQYLPFGFVRDLGSIGQPNEISVYGNGFGNSSYLSDGISINNRLFNSLDLNLFQSESIDSLEVIPLPRGFLFNEMNNPVSVNLISRDFVTTRPYTRIKFYQAPNEEGFFNGIFSSNISRRMSIFTEITHQSTDPRYKNSDYGLWSGSVRLRYLASNDFNITGGYSYYQSNTGLNGGVDIDSIKLAFPASQIEEILYSRIEAPVNFLDRYQKVSGHNLNIRLLANLVGSKPTDLTFYYQSSLIEFRQNENTNPVPSVLQWYYPFRYDKIIHNNEFSTYGAKLSQKFEADILNIYTEALYETTLMNTPLINRSDRINTFSAIAKASLILQSEKQKFIPSAFGKVLNYDGKSFFGAGADLSWFMDDNFSMYLGLSKFRKPSNPIQIYSGGIDESDFSILEAKLNYKNSLINISAGYFFQELAIAGGYNKTLQGSNLRFDWHLWKFLLSTNSNYYFVQEEKDNYPLPDFTSSGGIYYVDTLFNSNLKLKAGINYRLIGNRGYQIINFETFEITRWIRTNGNIVIPYEDVKPSVQFDFFLAGKIQDAATIYFVFENLLNEKYYIVPYFPKQERGLRLGVAWEFLD